MHRPQLAALSGDKGQTNKAPGARSRRLCRKPANCRKVVIWAWPTIRRVAQSFRFYGIAAFGLVLAGGLLASKCSDSRGTLALLSPMLAAVAATLTCAGLTVHQRVTDPQQAGFRLAGTSIALGGGLLAMAALALAWPRPDLLFAVGLLDAIAFTALAWFAAFAALNVVATASSSLALLVGLEWGTGEISVVGATTELLTLLLLTARSALILALLSVAADGVGCCFPRWHSDWCSTTVCAGSFSFCRNWPIGCATG
jgi:hypothetical protein